MNGESRRTRGHDDFPSSPIVPPYQQPYGEITAPRLTWALAYAELGWPVLPLHAGTKRPMTEHGVKDATTNPSQIRGWWSRAPHCNIGLATGVAFDVLDCDVQIRTDGSIRLTSAPALFRLNDLGLLAGCIGSAMTRHGGLHLVFPPSGLPTRHLGSQHLDLLGRGSYIVAPPSVVPTSGGIRGRGWYTWMAFPNFSKREAAVLDFTAVEAVFRPIAVASRPRPQGQGSPELLARFVRQAPVGSRNVRAFWALCRALEAGQPITAITAAAQGAGLDPAEISAVVRSARRTVGA